MSFDASNLQASTANYASLGARTSRYASGMAASMAISDDEKMAAGDAFVPKKNAKPKS